MLLDGDGVGIVTRFSLCVLLYVVLFADSPSLSVTMSDLLSVCSLSMQLSLFTKVQVLEVLLAVVNSNCRLRSFYGIWVFLKITIKEIEGQ